MRYLKVGPLHSILYVNDLHKALNEAQCIIFAEDTNIFIEHKEPKQIANIMNNELLSLQIILIYLILIKLIIWSSIELK